MQRSSVGTADNVGHKWYILRFSSVLFAFVSWTSSLSLMVLSIACRNWDIFLLSFVVDHFCYFVFFFIVVALVSLLFSHVCLFSCVCSFFFFTSCVCLSHLFVVVSCFVFKSLSSVVFVFSLQLFFICFSAPLVYLVYKKNLFSHFFSCFILPHSCFLSFPLFHVCFSLIFFTLSMFIFSHTFVLLFLSFVFPSHYCLFP